VKVIEYPPLDWSIYARRREETGCTDKLQESCPELYALGCDSITSPPFYVGGFQPPYPIMACLHEGKENPNPEYFREPVGLDRRYRAIAIFQDGAFKLIKKEDFKDIFSPIESADEAISYAMAVTSLGARFDIDPNANVKYLVDEIAETHAEETSDGYLVYLFTSDGEMGCSIHSFYDVKVLVTKDGDILEKERREIYKSEACFD
jgi:hypothetical protein